MQNNKFLYLMFLPLLACDGGGGSDTNIESPNQEIGVFLDSPVANIGYITETLSGVTNSQGEYDYLPGETVTFFIGDLTFPSITASGIITPLDLSSSSADPGASFVNMIRLLKTLDSDGNPSNGINISDDAKLIATQVNFDQPVASFEQSSEVVNFISNGGQNPAVTELVSSSNAVLYFQQDTSNVLNSITGVWTAGSETLEIFPNGFYEHSSGEIGTYTFSNNELRITSHIVNFGTGGFDNDQEPPTGPYEGVISVSVTSLGATTTMTLTIGETPVDFSRDNIEHPIVGAWMNGGDLFTFYDNAYYTHNSGELGKYSILGDTLQIVDHINNNGVGGLDNTNGDGPYEGKFQSV